MRQKTFSERDQMGMSLLTASATLHTHFGLSWSNEPKRHGSIVLESQKQPHKNQYRNSLLAYIQPRWQDSSSICLCEGTVTHETNGLWGLHHTLPLITVITVFKQLCLVLNSKDTQSALCFKYRISLYRCLGLFFIKTCAELWSEHYVPSGHGLPRTVMWCFIYWQ